jgi:hypothetical protein
MVLTTRGAAVAIAASRKREKGRKIKPEFGTMRPDGQAESGGLPVIHRDNLGFSMTWSGRLRTFPMSFSVVNSASDDRATQLRRVLESRTFRNTEVLKRLLDYLGRQALENPASDPKEYTVGVEAFGKPSDYDPQTDSSVRVQAGKLRLKLDEYYRTEAAAGEMAIELPKGHFKLEFRPAVVGPGPAAVPPIPAGRWRLLVAVAILFGLAGSAGVWYLALQRPVAGVRWTAEMQTLWMPFLASSRPIMVAIGAPLFSKIGNSFFRDPVLNTWDAVAQSDRVRGVEKALGGDAAAPAYTYTGVGEAEGAFALNRLLLPRLLPRGRDLVLQTSNLLSWEDIASHNMIFLGPPKYNLQTLDLPVQQDFEISHARVQNLRPAAGEPRQFEEKWSADRTHLEEGHALISMLPGLHGTGQMMILAGSSTECTRAAVEFVTRPEYVTPFVRWMRGQPGGVPQWYQVVIRAQFRSQMAIAIERVAFHALK